MLEVAAERLKCSWILRLCVVYGGSGAKEDEMKIPCNGLPSVYYFLVQNMGFKTFLKASL